LDLIKWITSTENIPSFVIVIVVISALGFESFVLLKMFLPVWFGKDDNSNPEKKNVYESRLKAKSVEELLRKDLNDRKVWQTEMEKKLRDVTLQACIAVMNNADSHPLDVFNAAIIYFKEHGNGNGLDIVVRVIKLNENNKGLWYSALNEDMKKNGPCEDRYFLSTLKKIEGRICKKDVSP